MQQRPGPAVVTPLQVVRTFARNGVRLVANYPNARPGPVIRADLRIFGRKVPVTGNTSSGWVTVFDSAHDAVVARRRSRAIYGKRNVVVRANVLVELLPATDRSARQQINRALSAVAG
jgi:hypothetical protein